MKDKLENKADIEGLGRNAHNTPVVTGERITQIVNAHIEGVSVADEKEDGSTDLNSSVRDVARRLRENPNDEKLARALLGFVTDLIHPYLLYTVRSLCHRGTSQHDADDLVQETLARVYETIGKLARDGKTETWGSPQAYIRKTARTKLMDALKARRRPDILFDDELFDPAWRTDPTRSAIQREEIERAQKALGNLKGCDRVVLALFYVFQLTYDEMNNLLGFSPAAIRVRKHRALLRLKEAMGEGLEPCD